MQDHLRLEQLFRILPLTPDLVGLRESVMALSSSDPSRRWSGSAEYLTVDKRVLEPEALHAVLEGAEAHAVRRVQALHRAVRDAVAAVAEGEHGRALALLSELGEAAVADGRWEDCQSYYGIVDSVAREFGDAEHEILAARRIARAHLNLGDMAKARQFYTRSLDLAQAAADRAGRVIARTGLGHIATMEGRWREAEQQYEQALDLSGAAEPQLRAQLAIALSVAAREQGRLDDAERWIEKAAGDWAAMTDADRSTWWNSSGMLLLERGDYALAGPLFERALAASPSHFDSAMILDNLADLARRTGALQEAEARARRAEEFAIAGGAPRALAEVYIQLGRIMRARGDANGVSFFEKALELARELGYPYTEGIACAEYALFRAEAGDDEEAAGLREAAHAIFERLGTDPVPAVLRGGGAQG